MHDNLKARLASGLGHAVPEHMEKYIDRANEFYRAVGYGEAPWQVIPLLAMLAMENGETLENKNAETPEAEEKVDRRTREYRRNRAMGMAEAGV